MAGRKTDSTRYSFDNTSPSMHQIYESPVANQSPDSVGTSSGSRKKKGRNRPGRGGGPVDQPPRSPLGTSPDTSNRHVHHAQSFDEAKRKAEEEEEAACSFEPTISPLARDLAARKGHVPIADRMRALEEDRRRRIEQLEEQLERENGKVYTFKPKVTKYEFKNKRESVVTGLEKREADRQYRLDQKRAEAEREELANATFKPKLSRKAQELEMNEGVFERLYHVRDHNDDRDADRPDTSRQTKSYIEAFDEARLYKEAELRREKHKKRLQRILEDEGLVRNERKISESSRSIAQSKLQKALMDVYDRLANDSHMLDFESLALALYQLGFFRKNKGQRAANGAPTSPSSAMEKMSEADAKIHQQLWNVMDKDRIGYISNATFLRIMSYVLDPTYHGNDLDARSAPKHLRELRRKLYLTRLTNTGIGKIREKTETQLEQQFKENYTFKPHINATSRMIEKDSTGDQTTPNKSRADQLIARRKKHEQKIEEQRLTQMQDELKECTFQPTLVTANKKVSDARRKESFVERLSKPKAVPDKAIDLQRERDELEQKECTFKPKRVTRGKDALAERARERAKKRAAEKAEKERAQREKERKKREDDKKKLTPWREGLDPNTKLDPYQDALLRMQYAQKQKEEKEERYNSIGRVKDDLKKIQSLKPFKFAETEKVKETAQNNPVLMYMDVNIAPGKTGRVAIHSGDNPRVLAHNFAAIYLLTDDLCSTLEGMIREHMVAMKIPITDEFTETWGQFAWSPHVASVDKGAGRKSGRKGTGGQAAPAEMS